MDKRILDVDQAAAYTGFKRSYIYKLCHLGRIPYYRPTGGKVYFVEDELEAFLLRGRRAADYELAETADRVLLGDIPSPRA
jgi:excisionase family DNA binding protein